MPGDNVLNVLQSSTEKRQRFLAAWKEGIAFLGPELFGPGDIETARDHRRLRPLRVPIEARFARESGGEQQFLAAMVSFFDPAWGAELAEQIACDKSLCGLTYNLDHERTELLCRLLLNYQGWEGEP